MYSEVPNNSMGQNNGIRWTNLQNLIMVWDEMIVLGGRISKSQ